MRRERTGIHARLAIGIDTTILAWSSMNVEDDEKRVRLANSAQKALGPLDAKCWPGASMKHALDRFCYQLWGRVVASTPVERLAGEILAEGPIYSIYPFIVDGGGTIIYAPPGRGKSFTAMLMAVSIDAGEMGLFAANPRKVLYINLERSRRSMADRLARVNAALGLPEGRELAFLNARGRSLHDIADAARKAIREQGIEVVFLDSVSRAGMGDLNENQPVNKIIDLLNGMCATWLGIAHTPRSDESHVYGSIHFDAGIDIAVRLTTEQKDERVGVGLSVTKANDGPLSQTPYVITLLFNQTGLSGAWPAVKGEFLGLEARPPMSLEDEIQHFLLAYGRATASEVASEIGKDRANVSRILNSAAWAFGKREGKHMFFAVRVDEEVA